MRFSTTVVLRGKTATGLEVPAEVVTAPGAGLDEAPRVVEVPADLAAALDAEPDARGRFDALSHGNQRRHVLAVEGAKAEATRARRVAAAVATLREE